MAGKDFVLRATPAAVAQIEDDRGKPVLPDALVDEVRAAVEVSGTGNHPRTGWSKVAGGRTMPPFPPASAPRTWPPAAGR